MPENTAEIQVEKAPAYEQLLSSLESGLANVRKKLDAGFTHLDDLTFMLQHEGHPFSLERFYMFRDMFMALPPKRMMFKAGRQTAKTHSACAANALERISRPETKSLIVTPFFGQVHRISTEVAGPMIGRGMFADEILERTNQQVLKRKYGNGSIDHYSYAFTSVGRIRSVSGVDRIWIDEIQDIRQEFLPIIEETSSGRPTTGWKWYTGTPLSMGNPLQVLWEESSQAEETVKCTHCGKWNIGTVDQHLIKMIGKTTCVCAFCDKPLDIMKKVFVPRYPDREDYFPGRHVSQPMHPMHALIPAQWRELRRKMEKYTTAQFYNEVLGESYDSADRMIDQPALRAACDLGPNTLKEALIRREELEIAAVGVDWTGGGDGNSLTKVVLGGIPKRESTVKILYMICLPPSMPIQAQVPKVMELVERFKPNLLAHDYSGHGWLFETLGLNLRLDKELIWPFEYGISPSREVVYTNESKTGLRKSLHLDHTRSLFALYSMVKAGRVHFPGWELQVNPDTNERPVDDFMHMYAETRPGLRSGEVLYVRKDSGHSDDFVHATNFLATACWYAKGSYPSIHPENINGVRLSPTQEEADMMEGSWMVQPEDYTSYVA